MKAQDSGSATSAVPDVASNAKLAADNAVLIQQVSRLIKAEEDNYRAQLLLDEQLKVYRSLNALTASLGLSGNVDETLQRITNFVVYELNFERCAIWVANESGVCTVRAWEGYYNDADEAALRNTVLVPDHPLWSNFQDAPHTMIDATFAGVGEGLAYKLSCNRQAVLLAGMQKPNDTRYSSRQSGSPHRLGLDTLALQLGTLITNAVLYADLAAERAQLESRVQARTQDLQAALADLRDRDAKMLLDLQQAKLFQQGMLPQAPHLSNLHLAVAYRPADLVGGDYYDMTVLSADHIRLMMFDIAGHGVQASLRTMVVKALYDEMKHVAGLRPKQLLSKLNEVAIAKHGEMTILFTACCVDLRRRADNTWEAIYASGGQPLPFFASKRGQTKSTDDVGMGPWLGAIPGVVSPEGSMVLDAGDRMFLCTDGLCEERNAGQEEFGMQRAASLFAVPGDALENRIDASYTALQAFCQRDAFEDDVTVMGLEVSRG